MFIFDTRNLHTRGSTAHDSDVHQGLFAVGIVLGLGPLQVLEDGVAQPHRLGDGLHRHSLFLNVFVAKEIGSGTGRQHQMIVVYSAKRGLYGLFLGVDRLHLAHAKEIMFHTLKDTPEGKGDVARLKACRSHLIDEGRKLVVVVLVDQHHLKLRLAQPLCQLQASQAAAYDNHSLPFTSFYVCSHCLSCIIDDLQ